MKPSAPSTGRKVAWLRESEASITDEVDDMEDLADEEGAGCCCRVCISMIVGEPASVP